MRALRVVGISEDGRELSVVLEDSARQERFTVPADEQLRAAARGDLTRLGQISIELESQLRPREIQARIRAGASVDQVAAAAGVPAEKIERYAYPVLLERSRTAEVAQRAHPMRADGPDNRMLGDVVAHTFGLRGQEYHPVEWDSWKGDDGRWVVALSWRAGRSDNRALWTFQPGAHGGTVTAIDEHAHDLIEGLPAGPLRTVGPVIDISRQDEQRPPAPEEGHELRAAASDIAARRDVSDWSRVAPEPRRPEPRRQAARAEPAEPQQREPHVRPTGPTSPPPNGPLPSGSPNRHVKVTRPRPPTARTAAATPHPPTAPAPRPSRAGASAEASQPATGPTGTARPDNSPSGTTGATPSGSNGATPSGANSATPSGSNGATPSGANSATPSGSKGAHRPARRRTAGTAGAARPAPPHPRPRTIAFGRAPRQRQIARLAAATLPQPALTPGLALRSPRPPCPTRGHHSRKRQASPTRRPRPPRRWRTSPRPKPLPPASAEPEPRRPSRRRSAAARASPSCRPGTRCCSGCAASAEQLDGQVLRPSAVPSSRRTHQRHAWGGRRPSRTTANSRSGRSGSALPCTACSRPLSKRDQFGRADPGPHGTRRPARGRAARPAPRAARSGPPRRPPPRPRRARRAGPAWRRPPRRCGRAARRTPARDQPPRRPGPGQRDELAHPRHRDRLEQRLLRREVPVDRARADARPRRDRVEWHAVSRFGERLAGRGEHPLAVAAGVGAQWSIGRGQTGRSFRIVEAG